VTRADGDHFGIQGIDDVDALRVVRTCVHFFAICARLVRNVLVDFARSRGYEKRGGGVLHVALDEALHLSSVPDPDLVAVDEALERLATFDRRKS
jgi:hypothetical protein